MDLCPFNDTALRNNSKSKNRKSRFTLHSFHIAFNDHFTIIRVNELYKWLRIQCFLGMTHNVNSSPIDKFQYSILVNDNPLPAFFPPEGVTFPSLSMSSCSACLPSVISSRVSRAPIRVPSVFRIAAAVKRSHFPCCRDPEKNPAPHTLLQ